MPRMRASSATTAGYVGLTAAGNSSTFSRRGWALAIYVARLTANLSCWTASKS